MCVSNDALYCIPITPYTLLQPSAPPTSPPPSICVETSPSHVPQAVRDAAQKSRRRSSGRRDVSGGEGGDTRTLSPASGGGGGGSHGQGMAPSNTPVMLVLVYIIGSPEMFK